MRLSSSSNGSWAALGPSLVLSWSCSRTFLQNWSVLYLALMQSLKSSWIWTSIMEVLWRASSSPVGTSSNGILFKEGSCDRASRTRWAFPGLWQMSSWNLDRYSLAHTSWRFSLSMETVVVISACLARPGMAAWSMNIMVVQFYEVLNLSYNPHTTGSFKFGGPV